MKLRRIAIHVFVPQLAALRKLSKSSGAPVAELIRRAIEEYLNGR